MNTINFTANFVKRAPVLKKDDKGGYSPARVNIVELDKDDANDIESLYATSIEWNEQGARYASDVFHEAVKGYEYDDIEKEHYYAVTEQTKDFHKLDPKKILGLMLFSESRFNENEINWFQVRPDTNIVNSHDREYKHVGKSLIDLLKERYWDKPIYVKSSQAAVDFYASQGFQPRAMDVPACMHLEV
ncbi:MAG: hypothetical protein K6E29_05590 [Cyanobacteria bacterium RUI128]|nr:hypothetical protein [Cyanobacteria bacterium RUI128]